MKVLHINCNYAGTDLHRHMIMHLNHCGIDSCVYVPVYCAEGVDVSTPGAEVILSQCFRRWHRVMFDYKQSRILHDVQSKCDIAEFDCIHAYTLFTDGNTARKLSQKYKIPYVVAVRSTDVNTFFRKVAYLRPRGVEILRDAAAVFFLSETYRTLVLNKYVPEKYRQEIYDKSYIVPNGIDDFWLDNRYYERNLEQAVQRLTHHKVNVVCVGQISKRKNMSTLQKALQLLRNEGWDISLTVVGKRIDSDEYKKVISDHHTKYYQPVPKEELIAHYREADLFALPSISETFGLVYAEAMTQGLPVLYSKGQGFDGQFPDGEVGFAIEARNPADIADKIRLAVENYSLLAENSLHKSDKFRWSDICGRYKEIYGEIAGK